MIQIGYSLHSLQICVRSDGVSLIFLEGVSEMNNVCINNVSDVVVLEQFSDLVIEINQVEEVVANTFAARTMCNIGGGGFN